ncbi:MAG: 4-(cytidine 5'-diphospho)-2-C-methyl-D-erythritol kinase [Candidatus Micrarchaeaceae archaeon]
MAVKHYGTINKTGSNAFITAAPAKINITLRIGKKGDDGMHNIESVMQTVSCPADHVELEVAMRGQDKGIYGCVVSKNGNNIVAKALYELSKEAGHLPCKVTLHKSIPVAAGMGGGSSDAAAVLRLANHAFGIGMEANDMDRIASRLGNDVAFLTRGGRAIVNGGMRHAIRDIAEIPDLYYLIARPHMRLSTKKMYDLYDSKRSDATAPSSNDFTSIACTLCPDTKRLLDVMDDRNAVEAGVTGKGPTVFAGYSTYGACEEKGNSIFGWLNGDIFIGAPTRRMEG